jgi:hypothetical protein
MYLVNGTAAPSVLGQIVEVSGDNTYVAATAGGTTACGVVGASGIAVGQLVPIITHGKAQVLLATDKQSINGRWATVDNVEAGKAAGTPYALGTTAQGIGVVLESKDAGALMWVSLTFSKSADVSVSAG